MNWINRRFLFFFLVCSVVYSQTPSSQAQPLLLENEQISFMTNADSALAFRLAPMVTSPAEFNPPETERQQSLSADQRKKLIALVSHARKIDLRVRTESCRYEPGVHFEFLDRPGYLDRFLNFFRTPTNRVNPQRYSFLLCFNCDVWAVESSTTPIPVFGDSRGQRAELVALVKELFGNSFFVEPSSVNSISASPPISRSHAQAPTE